MIKSRAVPLPPRGRMPWSRLPNSASMPWMKSTMRNRRGESKSFGAAPRNTNTDGDALPAGDGVGSAAVVIVDHIARRAIRHGAGHGDAAERDVARHGLRKLLLGGIRRAVGGDDLLHG